MEQVTRYINCSAEPSNISVNGGATFPDSLATRNTGLNPADNGWSDPVANTACGTGGTTAYIGFLGNSVWFTLTK